MTPLQEGEGSGWMPIETAEGELPIYWRQEHTHALSFRIFDPNVMDAEPPEDWDIEATVKWDGCINWQTSPDCMSHLCDPECLQRLVRAFHRIWVFTFDNLDVFARDKFPICPDCGETIAKCSARAGLKLFIDAVEEGRPRDDLAIYGARNDLSALTGAPPPESGT